MLIQDLQANGLVIHQKTLSSGSRLVSLLLEGYGLIIATAFSALSSKGGRALLTSPYGHVKCFLRKTQQYYTLTDIEELEYYSHLNLNLNCYYQASLYSEACIISHAAGADHRLYYLYCYLFTTLSASRCYKTSYIFFLLFLHYNGTLPKLPFTKDETTLLDNPLFQAIFDHHWPEGWFNILKQHFMKLFDYPLKSLPLAALAWG